MRESSPSSPAYDRRYRLGEGQRSFLIYPPAGIAQGPLLPPQSRVNAMGNSNATPVSSRAHTTTQSPRSNLSVLLEDQQENREARGPSRAAERAVAEEIVAEADSASEPRVPAMQSNSAPSSVGRERAAPPDFLPVTRIPSMDHQTARRLSTGDVPSASDQSTGSTPPTSGARRDKSVRRYALFIASGYSFVGSFFPNMCLNLSVGAYRAKNSACGQLELGHPIPSCYIKKKF